MMCNCKEDRRAGGGGINNSSQVVNQPPTICHTQENVRPFNQDYETEDGQPAGNLSICSEMGKLINEMNKESKDSQEKVRELIMFMCWLFVKL